MDAVDPGAPLTARFTEALTYTTTLHATQRRKGANVPSIAHLLGVTALVLEDGGDEDEAIAALLHDAVEDQGGQETLAAIRQRFGERVARIVVGCTGADTIPKPPWHGRKEHTSHTSAMRRRTCAASRLRTSSTMRAPSCAICVSMGMPYGIGSKAARSARTGTTARFPRSSGRRIPARTRTNWRASWRRWTRSPDPDHLSPVYDMSGRWR
jgi:hypothetical protein